MSEGTHTI